LYTNDSDVRSLEENSGTKVEEAKRLDIDMGFLGDRKARDFLEKQKFLCKFGQKVIDSVAQLINRLC